MSSDQTPQSPRDEAEVSAANVRDREKTRRWVAGVCALVVLVVLIWWLLLRVPDVTGLTEQQARLKLAAAGLTVDSVTTGEGYDQRPGTVAAQSPTRFALRFIADRVDLILSGSSLAAEETGPSSSVVESTGPLEMPETAPQTPQTKPVVSGGLSTEPNGPRVPQVLGMTASEARNTLQNAGYGAKLASRWSSASVPRGQVMYQSPAPGTLADLGTVVLVKISTGPPEAGGSFPDASGE